MPAATNSGKRQGLSSPFEPLERSLLCQTLISAQGFKIPVVLRHQVYDNLLTRAIRTNTGSQKKKKTTELASENRIEKSRRDF